jgi:flagellar protein FliJ
MTKWIKPLIRLSTYEVETLQKSLSEVVTRRTQQEMKIATLDAELEVEQVRARDHSAENSAFSSHMPAYVAGWKTRRAAAESELSVISIEEGGIRDELSHAFEDLKKFEHVAEVTRLKKVRADAKVENAAFDEAALRMAR